MGLFGKSHQRDPKEQVNEWCHKIRKEGNQLDRQVRAIKNEEDKVKRTLKQAAAKGDKDTCTILAREIVRSRKATNRIYTTKAHLNSVQLQMKNQLATLRVAGALSKSTEVMSAMQNLIRVTEIAGVMQEMSKEMMKAGIIEEMLDETMESIEDTEELEEEVQSEVDKVLYEITEGKLGVLEPPPTTPAEPSKSRDEPSTSRVAEPEEEEEDDEEDLTEMQTRLQALRS
ncbi:charged multivesicular body protein 3 [Contarinia nasturtii]|uniref:charged multivesicular body protein 3 n=1 Tax=Contarinia nasturtii TaxID=265458 RepID=UPI0012D44255|nr:charged multivesicular body protein 3 [Contarinia nasturtii]